MPSYASLPVKASNDVTDDLYDYPTSSALLPEGLIFKGPLEDHRSSNGGSYLSLLILFCSISILLHYTSHYLTFSRTYENCEESLPGDYDFCWTRNVFGIGISPKISFFDAKEHREQRLPATNVSVTNGEGHPSFLRFQEIVRLRKSSPMNINLLKTPECSSSCLCDARVKCKNPSETVPPIVHYIHSSSGTTAYGCLNIPADLTISIKSVVTNWRSIDRILIHTNCDSNHYKQGSHWKRYLHYYNDLIEFVPINETMIRHDPAAMMLFSKANNAYNVSYGDFGNVINTKRDRVIFISDWYRIHILKKYGGIYLDNDVVILNDNIDSHRSYGATMGVGKKGIASAMVFANKDSRLLNVWEQLTKDFLTLLDKYQWNVLGRVLENEEMLRDGLVRLVEGWDMAGELQDFVHSRTDPNWRSHDAIHLMIRKRKLKHLGAVERKEAKLVDGYFIFNNTLGEIVRDLFRYKQIQFGYNDLKSRRIIENIEIQNQRSQKG